MAEPSPTSASRTTDTEPGSTRRAKQLAAYLDVEKSMSLRAYNHHVTTGLPARERDGYFATMEKQLTAHAELIIDEKHRRSFDAAEVKRLDAVLKVTVAAEQLYDRVRVATSNTDRYGDAMRVLSGVSHAHAALRSVSANDLGLEAYTRIGLAFSDMLQIAVAFPSVSSPWATHTLDTFVAQTYRRLQQIASGNRKNPTETHDIHGALTTYENDAANLAAVLRRFAALGKQLKEGKFATQKDYEDAMLASVSGASKAFQDQVKEAAAAEWAFDQARRNVEEAEKQARDSIDAAQKQQALIGLCAPNVCSDNPYCEGDTDSMFARLKEAQANYEKASKAFKENDPTAGQLLDKAVAAQAMAFELMNQADAMTVKSLGAMDKSRALMADAKLYLDEAEKHLKTVRSRAYARDLKPETDNLKRNIDALRDRMVQIEERLVSVDRALQAADTTGQGLALASEQMSVHWVQSTAMQMWQRDHDALAKVSDEQWAKFMHDPQEETPKEGFFLDPADHWKILDDARRQFFMARADLVRSGGEKSAAVKLLDELEFEYRAHLMASDPDLLKRLRDNAGTGRDVMLDGPDPPEAPQDGMFDTRQSARVKWLLDTSDLVFQDEEHRNALMRELHAGLTNPERSPEYAARYAKAVALYGEPDTTYPVILRTDTSVNFNIYVFRSGTRYVALNLLDGKTYEGDTPEGALLALAEHAEIADGWMRYAGANGVIRDVEIHGKPTNWWDVAANLAMLAGGIILLAVPEPSVTKVVGGALLAAGGAYFVGKGTLRMIDLGNQGKLGMNWDTGAALLDIANGLLAVVDGGLHSVAAAGVMGVARGSTSLVVTSLSTLERAKPLWTGLGTAGKVLLATNGVFLVHNIAVIGFNPKLGGWDKAALIAENLALFAAPLLVGYQVTKWRASPAARTSPTEIMKVHQGIMTGFDALEMSWADIQSSGSPTEAFRANLSWFLRQAERFYKSPEVEGKRELASAAEPRIRKLRAILEGLPQSTSLSPGELSLLKSIEDEVVGAPTSVTKEGDVIRVRSRITLPSGPEEGTGGSHINAVRDTIQQRLAMLADKENGFTVEGAGTDEMTVKNRKGEVVASVKKTGRGTIEVENTVAGYRETIELKPSAKAEADAKAAAEAAAKAQEAKAQADALAAAQAKAKAEADARIDADAAARGHPGESLDAWRRQVAAVHEDAVSKFAARDGMSPEDWRALATAHIRGLLSRANIFMRIKAVNLEKVLTGGRFKSQFETGSSGGLLDAVERDRVDRNVFGFDSATMPVQKRPIYGYLSTKADGVHAGPEQYGDTIVRIDPAVKDRSTYTFGDSLDATQAGRKPALMAKPVNAPEVGGFDFRLTSSAPTPPGCAIPSPCAGSRTSTSGRTSRRRSTAASTRAPSSR